MAKCPAISNHPIGQGLGDALQISFLPINFYTLLILIHKFLSCLNSLLFAGDVLSGRDMQF